MSWSPEVHDVVGAAGVALIIYCYFALQSGRMRSTDTRFSLLNGAGAALVLLSLTQEFNLSAFVIEAFWLLISLYGLWKHRRMRAGT